MFYVFCLFTPLFRRFRLSRVSQRIDLDEIYRLVSKILNFTPCGSVFGRFCVFYCKYCLWSVTIACGVLLLLVECYDSLWNVTIACGMLRDATCSLHSHWLARCARTGLFLRKMHENLQKIYGNLRNLTKCEKIYENLMKIY